VSAFILTSGLLISSEAFAIPYQGNKVYRSTDNQGRPIIILSSSSASDQWLLKYLSETKQFTLYGNACGLTRINNRNNNIGRLKVGDKEIDISKIPPGIIPKCNQDTRLLSFNLVSDFIDKNNNIYLINAAESFMPIEAEAQYKVERRIRPNMCGFAVFRAPFRRIAFPSTFEWNNNYYQVSNLVVAPQPPRCVRNSDGTFKSIIPPNYN
jgi:hypothetical protein